MNSDYLRGVEFEAEAASSVPATNLTLTTDHIDMQDGFVGPIVARAKCPSNASLSGTLSFQQSATTTNGDFATITADANFPGGKAVQGVNTSGGEDFAAGTAADIALSVLPTARYVRAVFTVRNSTNAAITADAEVVLLAQPQVTPER